MRNNIFENNVSALKAEWPALHNAVVDFASSADHDICGEIARDTANAESSPAENISFQHDLSALIGIGDGEALHAAARAASNGKSIYIYEQSIETFARSLCRFDIADLLQNQSVHLYIGEDNLHSLMTDFFYAQEDWIRDNIVLGDRTATEPSSAVYLVDSTSRDDIITNDYQRIHAEMETNRQSLVAYIPENIKVYDQCSELAEFLDCDRWRTTQYILRSTMNLANDWNKTRPRNSEAIHKWYCDTEHYIFGLCGYHATSKSYPVVVEIVTKICNQFRGRILDFGGGDGDLAIKLAQQGLNIEYCDVPGKTLQYARRRFEKRGLDIPVIISDDPDTAHLDGLYNIIITLDVLEHLVNPLHYCEVFYNHLDKGGLLLARPSFTHDEKHPMHLPENEKLKDDFTLEMQNIGFTRIDLKSPFLDLWMRT